MEILHNGKWGSICDDEWDDLEADVVCRQLGFNGAIKATTYGHFGQARSEIKRYCLFILNHPFFFTVECGEVESKRAAGNQYVQHRLTSGSFISPRDKNVIFMTNRANLYISAYLLQHLSFSLSLSPLFCYTSVTLNILFGSVESHNDMRAHNCLP